MGVVLMPSIHRHDISDEAWALIEAHTIGKREQWGGIVEQQKRD